MKDSETDTKEKIQERSCGYCAGCILSPLLFLLVAYPLLLLLDWLFPSTDVEGDTFLFGLLGLPLLLVTGAFLGSIFSKQLVGLLKEIKWRIWDS